MERGAALRCGLESNPAHLPRGRDLGAALDGLATLHHLAPIDRIPRVDSVDPDPEARRRLVTDSTPPEAVSSAARIGTCCRDGVRP